MRRDDLLKEYRRIRGRTEELAAPLTDEDQQIQSHPDASPVKWHRAHTTWFFEAFVLARAGYEPHRHEWARLFNSYDASLGPRIDRSVRAMLSRPSLREIAEWRRLVDARVHDVLRGGEDDDSLAHFLRLGLAHEEQHQELILTDILHAFAANPLRPAYQSQPESRVAPSRLADQVESYPPAGEHVWRDPQPVMRRGPLAWRAFEGGPVEIGVDANGDFTFDNERPRHMVWLEPYLLASRVVTVGEVKQFIRAGGYQTPSLWLSDGFELVRRENWSAPLYARVEGSAYVTFTLAGEREAHDDEPARHLSYYEADAIARFMGARLPNEAEWEHAVIALDVDGHYGDVWEWTSSAYLPYPGFRPESGAAGEYNGKLMINQMVLRGGSMFSPPRHVRPTTRNFSPPHTRHQMTGVRLARDA